MSGNDLLHKIPVVVQAPDGSSREFKPTKDITWKRIATQAAFVALLILIPVTGIFRIDLSAGFVVMGRQIWFSDFFLVFGFWLSLACLLVLFYSTVGTAFCGWACPQNTLSSWANKLTMRLLGKRAAVDWDDIGSRVSPGKNKLVNWAVLTGKLLGAAMVVALIPLLYFYPPGAIWSFITFQSDPRLAGSLRWVYGLWTFIIFINLAVMRYYVCRYMCIYRIWQFLFKTKQTLHVDYDAARGDECAKCSYCVTVCPVGIDPKNTAVYDACTNCGACITACNSLHEKHGEQGLLSFKFGERPGGLQTTGHLASLGERVRWVIPAFVIGLSLLGWGLWNYQPYSLSAFQAETYHTHEIQDYHIDVANKVYGPRSVHLSVQGLPKGSYSLSAHEVDFATAGRKNVYLHVNPGLRDGIYPVTILADSDDGWHGQFRMDHVAISHDPSE